MTQRNPRLPEGDAVDGAEAGRRSAFLPGEAYQGASTAGNPNREVRLTWQESAEAIVPAKGRLSREGPNVEQGVDPVRSSGERGKQNTPAGACPTEEAVKPQGPAGGRRSLPAQSGGTPRGDPNDRLMEQVVARENMLAALKRVEQNGGAPGVDGICGPGSCSA